MTAKRRDIGRSKAKIEREAFEEIPEWTEEDFKRARPMKEVFPEVIEALERLRGDRGPQKAPTKERIGLRLDKSIVEHFRASGRGWQSRINEILAKHIEKENP